MLASTRLVQLVGVLVAGFGLWGYIQALDPSGPVPLSEAEAALINPEGESFQVSFVIAGRDIEYSVPAQGPIYRNGRLVGHRVPAQGRHYGNRTDSIFYVQLVGSKIYVIAIPRDVWLPEHQIKVNETIGYRHLGSDGLRRAVSEIVGLPIDYYAIVNIDIFERVVDAVGGVQVYVPYDMRYTDTAANLYIDFERGPRHLDGADAADFVRYRGGAGGDYGRIDNIKLLGAALASKLRSLDLRVLAGLPEVLSALLEEIDTNADPAIVRQLLGRAGKLEVVAATLPTHSDEVYRNDHQLGRVHTYIEVTRPDEIDRFLADTFGGRMRLFERAPETELIISNRSGWAGLEDAVKARLVMMGVPEETIFTQELTADPLPTRLQAEREDWESAAYYANMLNVERFQVYRVNRVADSRTGLELVLGQDALNMVPHRVGIGP